MAGTPKRQGTGRYTDSVKHFEDVEQPLSSSVQRGVKAESQSKTEHGGKRFPGTARHGAICPGCDNNKTSAAAALR